MKAQTVKKVVKVSQIFEAADLSIHSMLENDIKNVICKVKPKMRDKFEIIAGDDLMKIVKKHHWHCEEVWTDSELGKDIYLFLIKQKLNNEMVELLIDSCYQRLNQANYHIVYYFKNSDIEPVYNEIDIYNGFYNLILELKNILA